LTGSRTQPWLSESALLCESNAAMLTPSVTDTGAAALGDAIAARGGTSKPATCLPTRPLELDVVSGPRMGERFTLLERVCTIGRAEGSTIRISDPMISNISRLHCYLEYVGNRWQIRDNRSTNGTWQRLSCVLDPSRPTPLPHGTSVSAGAHELLVEEADMWHCWLPSTATRVLAMLCDGERCEKHGGGSSSTPSGLRSNGRKGAKNRY